LVPIRLLKYTSNGLIEYEFCQTMEHIMNIAVNYIRYIPGRCYREKSGNVLPVYESLF
jgi:hypothetical protein